MCGLQPKDDVSGAAASLILYHNRCVSTKQREGWEVEIFLREGLRLGKG